MATLVITNLTSTPLFFSEFYTTAQATGDSAGRDVLTVDRPVSTIPSLTDTMTYLAAGSISFAVTLSSDEAASGLASPPNVIEAADIAAITSTAKIGVEQVIRKAVTAGGGGSADDVTIYAVNTLPYKFRIIDAWAVISAGAAGGRTITIGNKAAAAGTSAGTLSAASTGRVSLAHASNASTVYTPGSLFGLFLRRSDSAIAGEVFIKIFRES